MVSDSGGQQRVDLDDAGPSRHVVAVGYLVTSLISASVALVPGWSGVHAAPILVIASLGLLSGLGLLLIPAWPVSRTWPAIVSAAVSTSAIIYAADGSNAIGVLIALYSATAIHVPFLRSRRSVIAATALPFVLLPAALLASGHPDQVLRWLTALPVATVVPVFGVRSLLALAARRARRDGDSDLLNRTGLLEKCATQLQESTRLQDESTVSVVHFDDLRDLRLALGPAAAEEVITECARRAADLPGAVVARIDLDSLAVVRPVDLEGTSDPLHTGLDEGRILREVLRAHVVVSTGGLGEGLQVRPDVSIGVACAPQHGRGVEDLLVMADIAAVHAAEEQGHIAVAEGKAAFDADALRLHSELPAAVAEGQLRVHYQRLVAAGTARTVGVEALVRWQHPQHGLLGPGAFIPLAERSQAIVGLTYWVLRTAAAQCAAWRAAGHDIGVSVNVSPVVLADPSLVNAVRRAVAENHLGDGVLTLEITESALLGDPEGVNALLAVLRAAGARISLDDFGTGHTSLTMLRQLEVDELKIDRCFVAAVAQAPVDAAIVRALVDLAHRLSMEVVAEGVEDASTADLLRALGADVLQGFHFARPVAAADVFAEQVLVSTPELVDEAHSEAVASHRDGPVPAPRLAGEEERVRHAYDVLTCAAHLTDPLRRVTALAAAVCGTDFASFNVVTEDHVHLLAPHGHARDLAPRDGTPCAWTVQQRDILHLDPSTDPRTAASSETWGKVEHYTGAPVIDADDRVLGVLCAYDRQALSLSELQRSQLQVLAGVVADLLAGGEVPAQIDRAHELVQAVTALDDVQDENQLIAMFATAVHELLQPDYSFVVCPTPSDGNRWQVTTHRGEVDEQQLRQIDAHVGASRVVTRSISTKRPVWVPDAATSAIINIDLARQVGAAAVFTVPVVGPDGVIYVLSAVWQRPQLKLNPVLRSTAVSIAARTANAYSTHSLRSGTPATAKL